MVGHVPRKISAALFLCRDNRPFFPLEKSVQCHGSAEVRGRKRIAHAHWRIYWRFLIWRLTLQSPNRQIKTTAVIRYSGCNYKLGSCVYHVKYCAGI